MEDGSISAEAFSESPLFCEAFAAIPARALIAHRDGRILGSNFKKPPDMQPPEVLEDLFVGQTEKLIRDIIRNAGSGWSILRLRAENEPIPFAITPLRRGTRQITQFFLIETDRRAKVAAFADMTHRLLQSEAAREREEKRTLKTEFQHMERFAYVAAHDLRAPLRNISSLLDFLEEDFGEALPDGAHQLLDSARIASNRLQTLISDLLSHARTGSAPLQKEPISLPTVLDEIRTSLASDFDEHGAKLSHPDDLGTISADPALFRQLMQNLISNAVTYRHPDRAPEILVRWGRSAETKELCIQDNGQGFDPVHASRIFEPFQRLHASNEIEGSGVGLATCAAIAERHGWTIRAEGIPGKGAVFIISGVE